MRPATAFHILGSCLAYLAGVGWGAGSGAAAAASLAGAGACVAASSLARARAVRRRTRELELRLVAAALERDHAVATVDREIARLKRDFVSMVSHEFRTPLASIRAYAEMLIDGEAADARSQREFYDVIHAETCRLGQSIDTVLSLTRAQAGLAAPDLRPTPLGEVAAEAVEAVRPLAARRRQVLALDLTAGGGEVVRADRTMLVQAVVNLIDHAVGRTPVGGRVVVRTTVDAASGTAGVRVEDAGPGLDPKDLPALFDTTYAGDETGRRKAPGPGLGLALARHVAEVVHGGRMTAEAEPGRGGCFGFELAAGAAGRPAGEQAGREPPTR